MSYNGAVLARARERLAKRREDNAAEQQRRTRAVYARIPRVEEIDLALRRQMAELCALTLSRDAGAAERVEALRAENLALQRERAQLLRDAGLPANWLDDIYSCEKCRDTGFIGSELCSCLRREYKLCLTRELSGLLRDGKESFASFRLDLYSAEPDPALGGMSPRETMDIVFKTCLAYARNFSPRSPNLLFRGGTGLGKTFLSACIAREAADRGYSVAYEGTAAALAEFERQKFSRDAAEADAAGEKVKNYLECDLMILDDLGTEMATSFSTAALYQLINTRLAARRSTVISTNLDFESLRRRYGAQIASRLEGEYTCLPFRGRDIRLVKKEREA